MTNLKMEIYGTEVKPMKIYADDFFDTITFTFLYVRTQYIWSSSGIAKQNK